MPAQAKTRKLYQLIYGSIILAPIVFFCTVRSIFAQQAISSATAIPPRLEVELAPGQTIEKELKVRNETDSQQYYGVNVDDFIVADSAGTPVPVSETISGRWSLKSWIKIVSAVPVDAKSTQVVKLKITAPVNAMPGGHYAMITYQPNPDQKVGDLKKTGSLLGQRVGTLVYVTVPGDIHQKAVLQYFKTSPFNEMGPVEFSGLVENNSDVHIAPKGEVIIKDMFGKIVSRIPAETGNIFPDVSKTLTLSWPQKWGYGRYSASLNLAYGTAGGIITATIFFWLFPIRGVIYILTLIIALLTIVIILNKRNKKHQEELEKEVKELKKELDQLENK